MMLWQMNPSNCCHAVWLLECEVEVADAFWNRRCVLKTHLRPEFRRCDFRIAGTKLTSQLWSAAGLWHLLDCPDRWCDNFTWALLCRLFKEMNSVMIHVTLLHLQSTILMSKESYHQRVIFNATISILSTCTNTNVIINVFIKCC